MTKQEEPREGMDEYKIKWLEAERALAIGRLEHPEYWRHWEDEQADKDIDLDK